MKLSAANSLQDWDEIVFFLFSSFLLENESVCGRTKSLPHLDYSASLSYHYTMQSCLNRLKQWYDKSCSHIYGPDTGPEKILGCCRALLAWKLVCGQALSLFKQRQIFTDFSGPSVYYQVCFSSYYFISEG